MPEEKNIIEKASEAFAGCPEQTPAEEQPAEQDVEPLNVTISLIEYIDLISCKKALAFLQSRQQTQENPLDIIKTKLELQAILDDGKRAREDWHDSKRIKARVRQIHGRLCAEPPSYIG